MYGRAVINPGAREVNLRGGNGPGEIGHLRIVFIQPGSGAHGTDKEVTFSEADRARVTYVRDGYVVQTLMTPTQAQTLLHQAEHDAIAMAQREAGESAGPASGLPACLVCRGSEFTRHRAIEQTRGGGGFQSELRVCTGCGYVMQFAISPEQ